MISERFGIRSVTGFKVLTVGRQDTLVSIKFSHMFGIITDVEDDVPGRRI